MDSRLRESAKLFLEASPLGDWTSTISFSDFVSNRVVAAALGAMKARHRARKVSLTLPFGVAGEIVSNEHGECRILTLPGMWCGLVRFDCLRKDDA